MTSAYISATFKDLEYQREAIRNVLMQLHVDIRMMEGYVADSSAPLARCLADVEACDIYIGIFAWRYGYQPPKQTKSITHLEYEQAVATGKTCLIFLHDEDASWPVCYVDRGADSDRVADLRRVLQRDRTCSYFDTIDKLKLEVYIAVSAVLTTRRRSRRAPRALVRSHPRVPTGLSPDVTQRYFERISQQYGTLVWDALVEEVRSGNAAELADVFVEPFVQADQRSGPGPGTPIAPAESSLDRGDLAISWPARPVLDVLGAEPEKRLVLVGDAGTGKSAVVRYLTLGLARAHADDRLAGLAGHLPVMIELRSYVAALDAGRCTAFSEYLVGRAARDGYQEEPDGINRHLAHGDPAVVVFDGLDEIFDRHRREEIAGQIATFAASFPHARVVVTARSAEHSRRALSPAGFTHYTLQPFAEEQTIEFLHRWYRSVPGAEPSEAVLKGDSLVSAIQRLPELSELAGNPMLLSILAAVDRPRMLTKQRWRLYEQAARTLVEAWDDTRELRPTSDRTRVLRGSQKRELLRRLAFDVMSENVPTDGGYLSGEQLQRVFAGYLIEAYQTPASEADNVAASMIEQLWQRSFILVRRGADDYTFAHRTFLEFFCAWSISLRFQGHDSTVEELRTLFRERWTNPGWRETLRQVAGRLKSQARAGELIELLVEVDQGWTAFVESGEGRVGPDADPPWNLALAVQCLAAVRPLAPARRAAELALRHVVRLIEYCVATQDPEHAALLVDEIIPAVEEIGPEWPGREAYIEWYRATGMTIVANPAAAAAARIMALLALPAEQVEGLFAARMTPEADVRVVCAAVAALGELIHKAVRRDVPEEVESAAGPLIGASGDPRAVVRLAAVQALGELVAVHQGAREVVLRAAEFDRFSEVQLSAVQIIGDRLHASPEAMRVLLACRSPQTQTSGTVRAAALRVLARGRQLSPDVERILVDACGSDPAPEVVETAAGLLLPRADGGIEARELLIQRLEADADARVRRVAVRLLARTGPARVLLDRVRSDRDGGVIRYAAAALAGRGAELRTRLSQTLVKRLNTEPDEVVRLSLVRAIGELCAEVPGAEDVLAQFAVGDIEPTVRQAALQTMPKPAGNGRRRALLGQILRTDKAPSVSRAAVEILAQDTDPAVIPMLAEAAAEGRDLDTRLGALHGLAGRTLPDEVGERLLGLTGAGNHPQIRLTALRALILAVCPGVDRSAVLLDRLAEDAVDEVFAAAADAALADAAIRERAWRIIADRAERDSSAEIRALAVSRLGSAGTHPGASEVIRRVLRRDPKPAVVAESARSAAELGLADGESLLLNRIDDPDQLMQRAVVEAAALWVADGERIRNALLARARSARGAAVRRAAVTSLAAVVHLPEVHAVLTECLHDTDLRVKDAARAVLEINPRWKEHPTR
ncbi:HEAT repeat domain-containing protein [Actinoplanes sp. NPDC020271]|uniref:HEAT repeat domain-containing protein n=1 Tax=Actinoplanes sp. NPDC020271 TaxID=3363896 RepID=UPI0037BABE19